MRFLLRLLPVCLCATPLLAQDLPPYIPVNPVLASRSPLYAQPYIPRHSGWQFRTVIDYSNAVETARSTDNRLSVLDAEFLEADMWATRDLSSNVFVVGDFSVRGGYAGALDKVLNWYHDVVGLRVSARNDLPLDTFRWTMQLPDTSVSRTRPGTFIGDVRAGIGVRFGRTQLLASVTAPTTTEKSEGWGRGTFSGSLALTANPVRTTRVVVDAGVNAGMTPTHGGLAKYQRDAFVGGMLSGRWQFAGKQVMFATIFGQSGSWQKTGFTTMDGAELTLDAGFLFYAGRHWPELQLGLTEDLSPAGPAVDIGFKFGARWR